MHFSHWEGRKRGGLSAGHRCWAHPSCREPRAPCLQRGMAAGNAFHTSTRKKFGGFSETVGKNDHKVTPFSTRHCNSLVHKGSMDGIKAFFNCWLLLNASNMMTAYPHLTIFSHPWKPPQQDTLLSAFCFLVSWDLAHSKFCFQLSLDMSLPALWPKGQRERCWGCAQDFLIYCTEWGF